jgi:DNA-binding NarL/FixJ family response regulator
MTKNEIANILKDYHWMLNSIKVMRESLNEVSSKVAQYGIEASMPHAKGNPGDPVFADVVRRSKYWKKIEAYEKKVQYIQDRVHLITDDRESEVLFWLLEGKSYRWIAQHMGLSKTNIQRIRDSIVDQLSENGTNGTNGTRGTNFSKQKPAC